jgi:aromatic-L-amino-acid/L-tryptophan decarboxylase
MAGMPDERSYHMTPAEFRRYGREVVDWVADYLEHVDEFPVLAQAQPGDIRARLPESPPEKPEAFSDVLADLERVVLPGITHWQSPSFFGYFPANSSGPSVLGELVSAGLGIQGMLWATSPAATELETHVLDWLVELTGLPAAYRSTSTGGGVIQDSASSSSLVAMLTARERATGGASNRSGVSGSPRLVAYASTQAHSSIEKAARIAGIGSDNLRLVDVDARTQRMRVDELERLMAADVADGRVPFFVAATVGTTSTTAVDPVREIGEVCRRYGAWLHVDAAMVGSAAICPELRWVNDGCELADSYVFNAHKWLFTNFDCSAFFVADRRPLLAALSILPEYLRNAASESGAVIDYRDWMIPLGRRFRALKLWFVLRWYGADGLRHHVREHVALATELAGWIDDSPDFELVTERTMSLVCFRHVGGEDVNERLLAALNASGDLLLTHTRVGGAYTLRLSVGGTYTAREHVERAWRRIRETAADLTG